MTISRSPTRSVGELLRRWREQRRLSQLELALQAEVSARHLSFVETGRAVPSREMVLHLADQLDVPLRERNQLLLAAGYAPVYSEASLNAPALDAVRTAIRAILDAHAPNPAVVVDRHWNMVDANSGIGIFTDGIAPRMLTPPVNIMRLSLHPEGAAERIVNLAQWRAHLLGRLRREVTRTADADLVRLYEEVRRYPCDGAAMEVDVPGPDDVVVPLRYRAGECELAFFSTVAAFGTPLDITVDELAIELFFPADPLTASVLARRRG